MYELPAYLVWGFLESGKSTLIKETLSQDYFNDGEKTMILTFEEGEVEYDKEMLEKTNSFVVNIENMEDFTKEFVRGCQRNYYPDRVMIEYNGMYSIDDLMDVVDETDLELYQVIVTVDASTADLYLKNMKSMFMEMFKMADLVIFNRCDDNTNMGSFRRSIKAVNPRAQVGFERADGKEMAQDELLPYDVNADVIKVEDEDYGIWYIDAMERPQVYEGKTVEMRVQVQRSPKMPPGMIIPGRKAMTCCEDDMTFIGYLCRLNHTKSKTLKRILNNEWVTLTAQIHSEYNEAYDKTMPTGIFLDFKVRIGNKNAAKFNKRTDYGQFITFRLAINVWKSITTAVQCSRHLGCRKIPRCQCICRRSEDRLLRIHASTRLRKCIFNLRGTKLRGKGRKTN